MKTTIFPKKEERADSWIVLDATDQVLGRLASKIATILRGKDKANYTPYQTGEHGVIVTNVEKLSVTGKKMEDKTYYHHTGHPGGIKSITYDKAVAKKPDFPLKQAVKGMLPKNKLGRKMLSRLRVYVGDNHPHNAQQPQSLEIKNK